MRRLYYPVIFILMFSACKQSAKKTVAENPLFKLLDSAQTNIRFANNIKETFERNVFNYPAFYNGSGVSIGDLNNDGLEDIYFSGNMTSNKLYLNKGNMKFEDVTDIAGVAGRIEGWKNGINMADVNGDGLLDIYICYSGRYPGENRKNQLFINKGLTEKGIPQYKEEAEIYGLADSSYSTQSYFFDYDKDGDLDMLLVNENIRVLSELDDVTIKELQKTTDNMSGTKLFRNDGGHFKDVTLKAGLHSSVLSYGLAAGIGDVNGDGWPDIYISNDYAVRDYLYINNKDGTFGDKLTSSLPHISIFSMGNNIVDINNDGLTDIYTLDMIPEDNRRQKLLQGFDNYESFDLNLRNGLYYQFMRNMLHVNNGNGTFSEVGQLAGVSNTDWSWAPLFADFDNDGWKDLFVTNGYLHDFTNMDVVKYNANYFNSINGSVEPRHILDMLNNLPSSDVKNYIYKNNGGFTFANKSFDWGVDIPSNSNGAAYADLDNDGDLDLIVNNINRSAFIYQNQGDSTTHFLKVKLAGLKQNTEGIGAKVTVYADSKLQTLEQMPSRGYLSRVSSILHYGLGKKSTIDSVSVIWQSGKKQVLKNVKTNQLLVLNEKDALENHYLPGIKPTLFKEVPSPIDFTKSKNGINDFKRQPLMTNPQSFAGPCMAKGDVNKDGLEDVYVGGSKNEPGVLYIQQKNGRFIKNQKPFEGDKDSEDADAVFFDANGDGFIDLYVVSGGYHSFAANDPLLQDRLYINDGKGNLLKSTGSLPEMHVSKSCARVADFNGDGYLDVFIGGRVIPGRYPESPKSYLLINNGKGNFTDQISSICPELSQGGMITDAAWIDLNGDKKLDLVTVGEWMPISVFINTNGKLVNKTKNYFDKEYSGWWNKLQVADFNGDGKPDLIVGNLGLNSQCKVSDKEPAEMYYKDFDDNGAIDPVLCFYMMGKSFPYITRDELLDQMSIMRPRFPNYASYADAALKDVFTADELKGAKYLKANCLKTVYFQNEKDGQFHEKDLPIEVQMAPVYTITSIDYDADGHKDLLLCGNMNQARLRFGKYDANYGILLKGDGKGRFSYVPQYTSGFKLQGDVRSVIEINNAIVFGINQQGAKAYQLNKK